MTGKQTTQARHIVDVLGGRTKAAEITGYQLTVIDSWLRTGWVHGKYHEHIMRSAWRAGVKINQLDFVAHLVGIQPVEERQPEPVDA